MRVTTAGAVVEDLLLIDADLVIEAPDVTVRRVELRGGDINNFHGGRCHNGLVIRRTTIRPGPEVTEVDDEPAVRAGGYVARRMKIVGVAEGFRVSTKSRCGPVKVVRSYVRVKSPRECDGWHGDALQGYGGGALTIRDSVLKLRATDGCGGTAPFFYPSGQGNTSVTIDGLVVEGGGYPFRLGTAGQVRNLNIVRGSWDFGPIRVDCSALSHWQAFVVEMRKGQPVRVRGQRCNTSDGS